VLRIASLGAIGLLALYYFLGDVRGVSALLQSGFTDDQIKQIEQSIKDKYVTKMSTSSSAAERYQIASGSTTVKVKMLKVSAKRLEGLATITRSNLSAKELGLGEINIPCEATLATDSEKYIWKCRSAVGKHGGR